MNDDGYGRFRIGSKKVRVHRLSYELHYGPVPESVVVRHKCDMPCCVNPEHLCLGTHADNVQDKVARGRQARGEDAAAAKLTEQQVIAIRGAAGSQRAIAKDYGLSSHTTVGAIKRREKWTHV